jgi:hypothetical protein
MRESQDETPGRLAAEQRDDGSLGGTRTSGKGTSCSFASGVSWAGLIQSAGSLESENGMSRDGRAATETPSNVCNVLYVEPPSPRAGRGVLRLTAPDGAPGPAGREQESTGHWTLDRVVAERLRFQAAIAKPMSPRLRHPSSSVSTVSRRIVCFIGERRMSLRVVHGVRLLCVDRTTSMTCAVYVTRQHASFVSISCIDLDVRYRKATSTILQWG